MKPEAEPSAAFGVQPNKEGDWTTGLCSCFEDPMNCCITYWCPCVTFGQSVEILDRGQTSCVCSGAVCCLLAQIYSSCWYTCTYRSKLRNQFSIPGDQCEDFCIHCWCQPCALCQEYRELKNRGLDPSKGWATIADQRNMQDGISMAPAVPSSMTR